MTIYTAYSQLFFTFLITKHLFTAACFNCIKSSSGITVSIFFLRHKHYFMYIVLPVLIQVLGQVACYVLKFSSHCSCLTWKHKMSSHMAAGQEETSPVWGGYPLSFWSGPTVLNFPSTRWNGRLHCPCQPRNSPSYSHTTRCMLPWWLIWYFDYKEWSPKKRPNS
jgi:hypothetical protein